MGAKSRGNRTVAAAAPRDRARPNYVCHCGSTALKLCVGTLVLALVLLPDGVAAAEKTASLQSTGDPSSVQPSVPAQQAAPEARSAIPAGRHSADFSGERASHEARRIADWIVDSADNKGLPFVVLDKVDARLFVFNADGRIRGAAPALLGSARGDDSVPGIGDREYADMSPDTRTTPAGRFLSSLGQDSHGEDVVWVDYDAAVAIHRVITTKPAERRLQRLATPTPLDNRISYGCINVPKRFYESVVAPAFAGTYGIVYILPETRPAREVFGSYDVDARLGANPARSANAQH